MMPSSYSLPVLKNECDSRSIWSSTAWRCTASASSSNGRPADSADLAGHDRHHAGQLRRAHDGDFGVGPGEQKTGTVRPAAHPVVAGSVGRAHDDGQVGHRAVGHGIDHLGAVLDDPGLLVVLSHHVAGGVLQEHQRRVGLVGQQDELGGLLGLVHEQHAVGVGQHADGVAVDGGPTGHQARAVVGLVLGEARAVDDSGDHLAGIERHPQVGGHDAEQLIGILDRLVGGCRRRRPELLPVEVGDDLASDADAVELVGREVVREARDSRVHGGAAELLVVGLLAGGHLDERRAPEEHLGPLVDHDRVVAHARHVGPAGRGVAEHQRDRGNAERRQLGEVVEDLTGGNEQIGLRGQIGATGLDQVDHRQPIQPGDLQGAQVLFQREGVHGAAPNRRIVTNEHAFRPPTPRPPR